MTKDEVVKAFYETRNREAMAHLLMRLRRLDVDRALFLLEGFAEKLMEVAMQTGSDAGYEQAQRDCEDCG